MSNKSKATVLIFWGVLLGVSGDVYAQGLVQKASKEAVKGAVKGVGQEINSADITRGAKQVTKGMIDGVSDAVPTVTSQMVNQANVNKKAIGKVARQVSTEAVQGAVGASVREMNQALGKSGDGPLVDTLAATGEKVTAAVVRAIIAEARMDPVTAEKLSAAFVRGARSEMQFNFSIWPLALAFVLGGLSTVLCGFMLMLLYILFQRRRGVEVVETATVPVAKTQLRPAHSMA